MYFGSSTYLTQLLQSFDYNQVFALTDSNTISFVKQIEALQSLPKDRTITIEAGDCNKNITSLQHIWTRLSCEGATRKALLINLGGGMITDIGGFAATTFKRGISFINIPTTLLSMIDASLGGKTGINFNGLKNEVGTFANPVEVIIDTKWLKTLNSEQMLSGYAEMLKHSLLQDKKHWADILNFDILNPDYEELEKMITENIKVKESIVNQDPHEQNLRKALNLGHTLGHAFEEMTFDTTTPLLHGHAVAWGLVCALYISCSMTNFDSSLMRQTMQFIRNNYKTPNIQCKDYDKILELIHHDKKNTKIDTFNFTLLQDIGQPLINQHPEKDLILESLDFMREGG